MSREPNFCHFSQVWIIFGKYSIRSFFFFFLAFWDTLKPVVGVQHVQSLDWSWILAGWDVSKDVAIPRDDKQSPFWRMV